MNPLLFDLRRPEDLVGVFGAVVAAHAQAVAGHAVQVFDAQHAVVLYGVDFAVDDLGQTAVDGDDGAVFDAIGHAVADHVRADGVGVLDVELIEVGAGQAQGLVGVEDDVGFAVAVGDRGFLEKCQVNVAGVDDGVDAADGLGIERVAVAGGWVQARDLLDAFPGFQPFTIDRQQA